jgi:CubicO group peptidase (beta-lactamase class C family)
MGLADTEGGLYLHRRDLAKLWYLMLQGGRWNETIVLRQEWILESVTPAIRVNAQGVQYGYKWWLYPYGNGKLAWAGNGFGGQFPIVIPDRDLVIVVNGWNVLPRGVGLGARVAIDRVLAAVVR